MSASNQPPSLRAGFGAAIQRCTDRGSGLALLIAASQSLLATTEGATTEEAMTDWAMADGAITNEEPDRPVSAGSQ